MRLYNNPVKRNPYPIREQVIIIMKYNLPERTLREITSFAHKHNIEKILLFGSRARGDHTQRSDVDIAVKGGDLDGFYWDIKENIHSLLIFDVVDCSREISKELTDEIERDGIVIYEKAV